MINTPANLLKFLNAARNLAKQGLKEKDILAFAKQEFGEVTDLIRLQINKIFKTKNQPFVGKKTKDPVFDNTVETIPFDDTGTPFNPREPQKVYGKPREGIKTLDEADKDIADIQNTIDDLNKTETEADAFSESIGFPAATKKIKNRPMTVDELENFEMDIGSDNLEAYSFDGTVDDGARILKEDKQYMDDMFMEYKKGNLDPVAGDKSLARKRFLEKKLEEMEMSGDKKLMTFDEIEELATFDLGTDMDKAVKKFKDKTLENSIKLNNFDPKGRKPSAKGGRIKMAKGGLPNILGF